MKAVHAVFDTNVVVSTLIFRFGALSWLRGAWRQGGIHPLISRENTAELIRVLAYPKFALNADDQCDLLDDYLLYCETVDVSVPRTAILECRDPFDRMFLELALGGQADALVTVDNDISVLAHVISVPILSPHGFKQRLDRKGAEN